MAAVPRRLTFGAHADAYERARPEWPEEAACWLVPEDAQLVVELGAGTGKLTRALAALGVRVVAVEPDPRMLAVLRGLGLEGMEGSAEEIPLGDGEASAVVAGSALHWFDLDAALPEFHRVLTPGGRLAFGWNHRDERHPTIAAMSEAIYASRPSGQTSGLSEAIRLLRQAVANGFLTLGYLDYHRRPTMGMHNLDKDPNFQSIRDELAKIGVVLKDSKDGTTWKVAR